MLGIEGVRSYEQTTTAGVVCPQPEDVDEDAKLLAGLRDGEAWARLALFDRHARHVERILARVLGRDAELADVLHDTFVQAYASVGSVRDAGAIKAWLSSVAVFTARGVIRRRKLRRWLRFWDPAELPEIEAPTATDATREALARTYAILDELPADERIAFTLRFVEGMDLTEVAAACRCSLATIKRRLARAEKAFVERAKQDPMLGERIEAGRWGDP